jgi:hypothetical protein
MSTTLAPEALAPEQSLDERIVAAFAENAKSADVASLLVEVKAAASAAELAADTAIKAALDPLISRDDLKLARRDMDDASFARERLQAASAKLAERVKALKALEDDRRMQAEHERILTDRDRLSKEMELMAEPIAKLASLVQKIEVCDREIRRLAMSRSTVGYIRPVLSGAAPVISTLFNDVLVMEAFIAAAKLQAPVAPSEDERVRERQAARRTAAVQAEVREAAKG